MPKLYRDTGEAYRYMNQEIDLSPSEAAVKFETYRFYLQCFHDYLKDEYGGWKKFGRDCMKRTQCLKDMGMFDHTWIERWMKICWNTEYIMTTGGDKKDVELMRINNQWMPIQCYYAIYAAAEALAYAIDGNKADGHQKTLRKVTSFFVRNGLSPWNKAYEGSRGPKGRSHNPVNFPEGITIPHNLQRCGVSPIQMIAKCLKVEHSQRIDDLFKKKPGLCKCDFDPGYTGPFHFLYRLRVKSNYKDVETFVSGATGDSIKSFSTSIKRFCFWSLLYMEIVLIRKCHKDYFAELAGKYLKLNPRADRLKSRKGFYEANIL